MILEDFSKPKHVAVLMGGWSSEREVSLTSGAAVCEALKAEGYKVTPVDVGRNVSEVLAKVKPDVAFNALHGPYGEDGTVQGILEILGLPYTHSGVLASALAMNKPMALRLFREAGIPTAEGRVMTKEEVMGEGMFAPPYVIKPLNEGSSVGVRIVLQGDNFVPQKDLHWTYGRHVLVERYVAGREIQVAVLGEQAIGAIEIRPEGRFYDYEAKYTAGKAQHIMPAPLPEKDYAEACRLGALAHTTLGCRGVSRVDMRFDDTGTGAPKFAVLEVNTQPGMTPLSLVPEIASHNGMSFGQLVKWMVEDAGCDR